VAEVIVVLQYWVGNTTLLRAQVVNSYVACKIDGPKSRTIFSACHLEDVSYSLPLVLIIRVIKKKTKQQQKINHK